MAETTTTGYPVEFAKLLDRAASALNTSRMEVIQKSVQLTANLLNEASRTQWADLDYLRESYGGDARIVIGVFEENGQPMARMQINGAAVDDVIAYARVDKATAQAHVFLEVVRAASRRASAAYIAIGDEALFVTQPRMPAGVLPWPPKPDLAIEILLSDIGAVAKRLL